MANKKTLIVGFLAVFNWIAVFAQKKLAVVAFPAEQHIVFNSSFSFNTVRTKLIGEKDQKMQKMGFEVSQPTHIYFMKSFEDQNKVRVMNKYSLLVFPGDSIVLGQNKEIKFASSIGSYLDSLITMPLAYEFTNNEIQQQLARNGLDRFIACIQDTFEHNNKKIEELKFPAHIKAALHSFNYLTKCKTIIGIDYKKLNTNDSRVIDSLYADIIKNSEKFDAVNSPFVNTVYYYLLAHRIGHKGLGFDKVWDNLKLASDLPFFRKFLKMSLYISSINGPKDREWKYDKIKAAGLADPEITAVYLELKNKKPVLENLVVPNLDKIRLSDRNGKELSLATILSRNKGKIILVDFWASWCVPCRGELPKFVKYRSQFKNSPVTFVNFSIDLDSKIADWKKALIEEKETNSPNQFRLVDWENSELAKLIGLRSIPRYIIINDKGKILNSEFLRPSNPAFAEELKKYISGIPKQ